MSKCKLIRMKNVDSSVTLATLRVRNSHMWLVATVVEKQV